MTKIHTNSKKQRYGRPLSKPEESSISWERDNVAMFLFVTPVGDRVDFVDQYY